MANANPGPAVAGWRAAFVDGPHPPGRASFATASMRASRVMSFLAEAELTIVAPAPRVFDRLADLASWPSWMPGSFVPVAAGHEASPLRLGDRFRVRVAEAPFATTLRVSVLERPRELGWRGGLRGVLWAEHRFVLEPMGDERTRVRSIETWHGPLALVARRFVQPLAEKIGAAQLAGLAKAASLPR